MTEADAAPDWLVGWHAERGSPLPRPSPPRPRAVPKPRTPKPKQETAPPKQAGRPKKEEQEGAGFIEPAPWAADGGARREPVMDLDHDPPCVVRYVGWRSCIRCQRQFWSEDVKRLRMCVPCKEPDKS